MRRIIRASLSVIVTAALAAGCGTGEEAAPDDAGSEAAADSGPAPVLVVEEAGLEGPESVLHDPDADVYLVSNVAGGSSEKDGNGFISRIRPDGTVAELRWIDGAADGVTLHAPKGSGIHEGVLHVTDIDCVRRFSLETGEPLGEHCIEDAGFLNDLAIRPDGTVYFSDSATNTIWRIPAGADAPEVLAQDSTLGAPNGLAVAENGIVVVTFGSSQVLKVGDDGNIGMLVSGSPGRLDGVVLLEDGSLLVSTWGGRAVHRLYPGQQSRQSVSLVAENVTEPADIGFDATRSRVLVPLLGSDRIEVYEVELETGE